MNKIQSFALTAAFALALAFTFSCSSDDGDDNKGSGGGGKGENGSYLRTETYSRNANCDEGKICLIEEYEWDYCQEDGTLKTGKEEDEWNIEYSIDNKVLSLILDDYDNIPIKFNGTSDKIEGTWTRSKNNKEESCREEDGYINCDYGWDYTKAVFTSTTATFTQERCLSDYANDGKTDYNGWTVKVINCSNVEYSKGNEKINEKQETRETIEYTYNNKTCKHTYKYPTNDELKQACKNAYDKANEKECDDDNYWLCGIDYHYEMNLNAYIGYDKFAKCLKDNNFPKDFFQDDYDDDNFILHKASPKKILTQKALRR